MKNRNQRRYCNLLLTDAMKEKNTCHDTFSLPRNQTLTDNVTFVMTSCDNYCIQDRVLYCNSISSV